MADVHEARSSFEAEVLPHLDAAYRLALTLSGREADAEDLVQESCLRAYRGFAGFRPGTNARAWLLTIVRHTFFNLRRQARLRPREVALAPENEAMDTHVPGPEEQVLRRLERERLFAALAGMSEPYRSAVALVDLAELHYDEAAAVLGCPRGTVMSRLHRGRLLLAERMGIEQEYREPAAAAAGGQGLAGRRGRRGSGRS
jgi:RNA polymerase sigma-70 factor (ECF subfamily)